MKPHAEPWKHELGISGTAENAEVAEQAEIILIGVKPAVVLPVLARDRVASSKASSSSRSRPAFGSHSMEKVAAARFMRAMTNTPSAICRAATALAKGRARPMKTSSFRAREIFSAIGAVVEVEEEQIDAVTGLAGSGPAFVYTVIEALAHGGEKMGLPSEVALTLATQTVLGAAQLAAESKLSPEESDASCCVLYWFGSYCWGAGRGPGWPGGVGASA